MDCLHKSNFENLRPLPFKYSGSTEKVDKYIKKEVNGMEIGELPVHYILENIFESEHPVIGVYVHPSITPGFKYHVRMLGNSGRFIFDGPKYLLSVGYGIAKRLTFQGASLNNNKNFFWSDSNEPFGFALRLDVLNIGNAFNLILNNNTLFCHANQDDDMFILPSNLNNKTPIGSLIITSIFPEDDKELKTLCYQTNKNNTMLNIIEKHVLVKFSCHITFASVNLPIKETEYSLVEGTAVLIKEQYKGGARSFAELQKICNVTIPGLPGSYTLNRA